MIFCECHFIDQFGEIEIEYLTYDTLADCLESLLGSKDGENATVKTVLEKCYSIDFNRYFLEFRTC